MSLADTGEWGVSDSMTYCSSCGVSLLFAYDFHTCAECGSNFCSSCNGLKLKLAYMNGRPPGRGGGCVACRLLKKTNKEGKLKDLTLPNKKEPEATVILQKELECQDEKSPKITSQNEVTHKNMMTEVSDSTDMPNDIFEVFVSDDGVSEKHFFRKSEKIWSHENDNILYGTPDEEALQKLSAGNDNDKVKDTSNFEITSKCENNQSDVESKTSSKIPQDMTHESDPTESEIIGGIKHSDRQNNMDISVNTFQDQKVESRRSHSGVSDRLKTGNTSMGKYKNLQKSDEKFDSVDISNNPLLQSGYRSIGTMTPRVGRTAMEVQSCKYYSRDPSSSGAHVSGAMPSCGDVLNTVLPSSSSTTTNQNKDDHSKENVNHSINPYKDVDGITEPNNTNAWSNIFQHVNSASAVPKEPDSSREFTSAVPKEPDSSRQFSSGISIKLGLTSTFNTMNIETTLSSPSTKSIKFVVYGRNGDETHSLSRPSVIELDKPADQSDRRGIVVENRSQMSRPSVIELDKPADRRGIVVENRSQMTRPTVIELDNPADQSELKDIVAVKKKMASDNVKVKPTAKVCPGCGRPDCTGNKYMILLQQMIKVAQNSGLEVRDVVSDGNCMFTAVIDQLSYHGDRSYSLQSLRKAVVSQLRDNPHSEGTHYREFLSSETWEEYLNRMERDGEWGDHMTLRAIAEITSRTIQVISGEEGRDWTVIEPKFAGSDKLPAIYLGHVGEFHYVSLRPSVHWKSLESSCSVGEDEGDTTSIGDDPDAGQVVEKGTQEEFYGSEKADMFKEEYLDAWTELPTSHFSFILKRIFPHKFMEPAKSWAVQCLQFVDQVDFGPGYDKYIMGSVAEGFFVPGLEMQGASSDWIPLTFLGVSKNITVYPEGHKLFKLIDLFYETNLVHPGYLHLVARYGGWGSATSFVPSTDYRKSAASDKEKEKFTGGSNIVFYRELEIALFCAVWPAMAEEWQHRKRHVNWPKEDIIQKIVSEGCHVGTKAHKLSTNPNIEWQFLFCKAENTLALEALSKHQKYCYILFKTMYSHFLKQFNMISSGHVKSVFFYACEFVPESMWSGNPGACVLYLMDQLRNQIEDRNIPNYFIPGNNMIDHFTEEMFEEIQPALMSFRTQPLSAIQQLAINNRITCAQSIIEKTLDDVTFFREHRSVRDSTFTIFLPETIKLIQNLVYIWKIKDALELASEAYEERLAVSTCSDSVPFQMFLSQVIMNMSVQGQWWFCYNADSHFGLSLVQELSTSIPTLKFGKLVGEDVAGVNADLLVPVAITTNTIHFCYDFAKELNRHGKFSESLPYLHFCMNKYKEIKPENIIPMQKEDEYESEYDATKSKMLQVYWLAYCAYKALDQLAFFQDLMPEIQELCVDINTENSSGYLSSFLDGIEDLKNSQSHYERSKTSSN